MIGTHVFKKFISRLGRPFFLEDKKDLPRRDKPKKNSVHGDCPAQKWHVCAVKGPVFLERRRRRRRRHFWPNFAKK